MTSGLHCGLCHRKQVVVYYDGADMPIGLCCVRQAFRLADMDEVEQAIAYFLDPDITSVLELERRLNGR